MVASNGHIYDSRPAGIRSLNQGKGAASANATEAQGLHSDLLIARGSQVLLTWNLWQEAGLTNGARGTVKYIIYTKGKRPPSLPDMVIVEFDQYIGPSFLADEEKCIPVVVQERHFIKNKEQCLRKALPLKPGYAISIHSSQGATLDSVIVNLGSKEFANGLTYVAATRVRRIQDLYFEPMPSYSRIAKTKKGKVFEQRLKQDAREYASDQKYASMARERLEN